MIGANFSNSALALASISGLKLHWRLLQWTPRFGTTILRSGPNLWLALSLSLKPFLSPLWLLCWERLWNAIQRTTPKTFSAFLISCGWSSAIQLSHGSLGIVIAFSKDKMSSNFGTNFTANAIRNDLVSRTGLSSTSPHPVFFPAENCGTWRMNR